MDKYLIGLMGAARAGKDTVAAHLVETAGFERRGFADALKALCREVLDMAPYRGSSRRDVNEKTSFGRWFLQVVGTEIVRRVDPGYWVDCMFEGVDLPARLVIADVRFPNEYDAIRYRGGVVWRVERTGWEEDATIAAHASEQAWRGLVPDDVVSAPSGDLAALRRATDAAWARLQGREHEMPTGPDQLTWRAHVAALAEALRNVGTEGEDPPCYCSSEFRAACRGFHVQACVEARAALARLPAAALAERRALEGCRDLLQTLYEWGLARTLDAEEMKEWRPLRDRVRAALLDAVRPGGEA